MSAVFRWAFACLLAVTALLFSAGPAAAHASLERTEPAADSIVATAPTVVLLHFGESVGVELGTVKVVGPDGSRADVGRVLGNGRDVRVPLRAGLGAGTYVVAWRVTSADSHPISGGFAFSIGRPSTPAQVTADSVPGSTGRLMTVGRFASYLGLMLLVGAVAVISLCWPLGASDPRVVRLTWAGWGTAVAGSVVTLLLQGPRAAGLGPMAAMSHPALLSDVLQTKFGQAHVSRLALLLAATPLVVLGLTKQVRQSRLTAVLVTSGVGLLCASYSLAGHAAARRPVPVSVLVDMTHLLAVGAWLGGLVVVTVALLRSREAALSGARWSRLAFGCVVTLTVSGTVAGFREVGSWAALWNTRYGELLVAKTTLVTVMVGMGALGRWLLQRRHYGVLARSVRREAALGVGVLAITSVLVATVPASAAYVKPYTATKDVGPITVELDVEPARTGTDAIHIYVTDGRGKAVAVQSVTLRVSLVSRALGPIDVTLAEESRGHVETRSASLPYAGQWTFALEVRVTDIDSYPVSFTVPVR